METVEGKGNYNTEKKEKQIYTSLIKYDIQVAEYKFNKNKRKESLKLFTEG